MFFHQIILICLVYLSGHSDLILVPEYTTHGLDTSRAAASSAFKGSCDQTEVVQGDERPCSLQWGGGRLHGFNIWLPSLETSTAETGTAETGKTSPKQNSGSSLPLCKSVNTKQLLSQSHSHGTQSNHFRSHHQVGVRTGLVLKHMTNEHVSGRSIWYRRG